MAHPKPRQLRTTKPDFKRLLAAPDLDIPLPDNFNSDNEAKHLDVLYDKISDFSSYKFLSFIHAGGSGMQFRVLPKDDGVEQAMKIARSHFFTNKANTDGTFSPVSQSELKALEVCGHPNLVRLFKVIKDGNNIVALCTTLVRDGLQIDLSLDRAAQSAYSYSVRQSSPKCSEIDLRARFLIDKFTEVASALSHMHEHGIYHFDVKSANILISATNDAMLTDMGSCVFFGPNETPKKITTRGTWAYAHPDIHNIAKSKARYIEDGGLKTKSTIDADQTIAKFDLYALAKTIQECLARIHSLSGQQCFASYPFRFLHLVACLLLDGRNHTDGGIRGIREENGHYFVDDIALGYSKELFIAKKITTARDLVRVLSRFGHPSEWSADVPELDFWVPNTINPGISRPVPYTKRVEAIMVHPTMIRLKNEIQLGWIREVFPGAVHTRWEHTLGVFGKMVSIYNALLSDPEVPTALVLIDPPDIEAALVAALLHDAGQTTFGHDFENILPKLQHEHILLKLLDDPKWRPSLRKTIETFWPRVSLDRVLGILKLPCKITLPPVDGIAMDCISGPIDADKQDYLERDSVYCGVPYGKSIDHDRLLRSLTVATKGQSSNLCLAYKAKGRSAFEALLFARYHMYTAVYWHHSFRSMQAMFLHAAAAASISKVNSSITQSSRFPVVFYKRVVCGFPWDEAGRNQPTLLKQVGVGRCKEPKVRKERAIDLLWLISDIGNRQLIERMATRRLHKRIYEINLGDITGQREEVTYYEIRNALAGRKRIDNAKAVEDKLVENLCAKKPELSKDIDKLRQSGLPLIILDVPSRGVPRERNVPHEVGDSIRKYYKMAEKDHASPGARTFVTVQRLQEAMACFRVFAAPEFHDYVVQYLEPSDIIAVVTTVLPEVSHAS